MLAVIDKFGPSGQADLGRRLGMDRRSVSEEAAGLERGGLVTRGPDPADSRRNRLEITAAGQALLARLESSFRATQDELLVSLSPEDRAELSRLLALITGPARQLLSNSPDSLKRYLLAPRRSLAILVS